MSHALIIGKFYPPHKGHHYLIDTAIEECDRVTVLVLWSDVETIPGPKRAQWLRERHLEAWVDHMRDEFKTEYSDVTWELHMGLIREAIWPRPITHVYSSEEYGAELARRLSGEWTTPTGKRDNLGEVIHRMVDQDRRYVPMSATKFRDNPSEYWHMLDPVVKAGLTKRVVVCGAESSGTTTLTKALAAHYNTVWVPEWGRIMSETRETSKYFEWDADDFAEICNLQPLIEDKAARTAGPVMFCDTDLYATAMFADLYDQEDTTRRGVEMAATERIADLYIVTSVVGVPFEDDGFRLFQASRRWQQDWFWRYLPDHPVIVSGTPEQRLEHATQAVDTLLDTAHQYALPLEYR